MLLDITAYLMGDPAGRQVRAPTEAEMVERPEHQARHKPRWRTLEIGKFLVRENKNAAYSVARSMRASGWRAAVRQLPNGDPRITRVR